MLIPWFPGILLFLSRLGRAQDQDDSMMEWTTAYSLEGEHEIGKNTLLTTLPKMTKEWKVAFDINPTDYSVAGMTNLLHLTQGGNKAQVGDRIPAIWFHKTQGVIVSTAMAIWTTMWFTVGKSNLADFDCCPFSGRREWFDFPTVSRFAIHCC